MTKHYYILRVGRTASIARTRAILKETNNTVGPLHCINAALYAMRHNCPASAANTAAQLARAAIEYIVRTRTGRRAPVVQLTLWSARERHDGQDALVVREVDGVPTHVAVGGVIYRVPPAVVARIRNWPRFTAPEKQGRENDFPVTENGDSE